MFYIVPNSKVNLFDDILVSVNDKSLILSDFNLSHLDHISSEKYPDAAIH